MAQQQQEESESSIATKGNVATSSESHPQNANELYALTIDNELRLERDRKVLLDQRAVTVLTSCGVLVTLVFGFGAFVRGQSHAPFPVASRVLLSCSVVAFVAACLLSLLASSLMYYRPLGVNESLRAMVNDRWNDDLLTARRALARFRVSEVDRWRENNGIKAARVQRAIAMECLAVALLASAIVVLAA